MCHPVVFSRQLLSRHLLVRLGLLALLTGFYVVSFASPARAAEVDSPDERIGRALKAAAKELVRSPNDKVAEQEAGEATDTKDAQATDKDLQGHGKADKKSALKNADNKPASDASQAAVELRSKLDPETAIPEPRPQSDKDLTVKRVLSADIDGSINPGSKSFMLKTIGEAQRRGFDMVVFRLDTPGGLLDATRDIVKGMMAAKIPIAVLVAPSGARAASAGTFITMAAQVAAMAPGTNIGAAHPVTVGGGDDGKQSENAKHLATKAEEDTAAFIEGIAEQRRRNKVWARKAVVESVSIVSSRALELGVIDVIAGDIDELLEKADGLSVEVDGEWQTLRCQGALVERREMSVSDSLVDLFSNPNISYLLFMAGLLGIAMELYHPGVFFPGVLGGISLILAFISFQLVPINVGGLLLILLGVGMLVAEAFLPSFGALGIGGAVALMLGGTLLVDDMNPNLWADPGYGVSPWTLWPTILVILGILATVGKMIWTSRKRTQVNGRTGMVGLNAQALTVIDPSGGRVQFGPETWRARAAQPIAKGQQVRIVAAEGLLLEVEAVFGLDAKPGFAQADVVEPAPPSSAMTDASEPKTD